MTQIDVTRPALQLTSKFNSYLTDESKTNRRRNISPLNINFYLNQFIMNFLFLFFFTIQFQI